MKRIFINFLALSLGECVSKGVGFLTTMLLFRALGASTFGFLSVALAISSYVYLFTNPGLDTVGVRDIAQCPKNSRTVLVIISISKFTLFFVSTSIIVFTLNVFSSSTLLNELIILFIVSNIGVVLFPTYLFQGRDNMSRIAFAKILQSTFIFILVALFISKDHDVLSVPLFYIFIGAIIGGTGLLVAYKEVRQLSVGVSFNQFVKSNNDALLLTTAFAAVTIYQNLDVVMIGLIRSSQEVGVYAASYKIYSLFSVPPLLLYSAWLPTLSRSTSLIRKEEIKRYAFSVSASGFLFAGIGYINAPSILLFIFGSASLAGVTSLRILFFVLLMAMINVGIANPLQVLGEQKNYLLIVLTGAVTNIIMNFILIPSYGIEGAAIATLTAEIAVFIIASIIVSRILAISILSMTSILITTITFTVGLTLLTSLFFQTTEILTTLLFVVIFCSLMYTFHKKYLFPSVLYKP